MRGLTSKKAQQLIAAVGPNTVPEKKISLLRRIGKWLFSPITLMLLAAAGLSWASQHTIDLWLILFLTFLNGLISLGQEYKASKAIDSLRDKLQINVRVLRDDSWVELDSRELVPGDIIELSVGSLVPADSKILSAENLSVNEASITGESLPKSKSKNQLLLAGSYLTTGVVQAEVTKTGAATAYGRALMMIEKSNKRSLLEKDILGISYLLAGASLAAVALLTIWLLPLSKSPSELLRLDLSLIIAGVPISLPTVMTIIISIGVTRLSHKNVIVRQMSALENLANVNLLLSDKTGTLTQNRISVVKVITYGKLPASDLLRIASTIATVEQDPINYALRKASANLPSKPILHLLSSIPADSERKRTSGKLLVDGKKRLATVGAFQIVRTLCRVSPAKIKQITDDVEAAANEGFRTLAVAYTSGTSENNMKLVGLILLADPPLPRARGVISYLGAEGIQTKMLTGDNLAIAQHTASQLGLKGAVLPATKIPDDPGMHKGWWSNEVAGFAEILPEDKYQIVEGAKRHFVVAATGDGVNDLPSLSTADIGIAVSNAVDSLKSSADIVLTTPGIEVIKDALIESRKVFERLYSYSVYRISESLRLIITIAVLGVTVHTYPITPAQIILIAFLNDLPIITLAFNRVKTTHAPAMSRSKRKTYRGVLHGGIGIASSLLMFYYMYYVANLPLEIIQTAFFLKLTVAGHMLIYVAHTDERWYRFLPSRQVILATTITQLIATLMAGVGLFMAKLPIEWIVFVWIWSFAWMQASDLAKVLVPKK